MVLDPRLLTVAALSWALATPGAASPGTEALELEAETRAHAAVGDLLRTLCPEQCVLLSVSARVDAEPVGQPVPGFSALSGGGEVPFLAGVDVAVLADRALPAAFRRRLQGLVEQRLSDLGGRPTVRLESLPFPSRAAPHLEAEPEEEPPVPEPKEDPASQEEPPLEGWERLEDELLGSAALLALVALVVLGLLGVAALLVLGIRRASPREYEDLEPELEGELPAPPSAPVAHEAPAAPFPSSRMRRLVKTLTEDRSARNAVMRRALQEEELDKVCGWVRSVGDFVLDDLRQDIEVRPRLAALAELLSVPAPPPAPGEREASLEELEGRLLAARLTTPAGNLEEAFGFLESVAPERFTAACGALSASAVEVALRYARPQQRRAYLSRLGAGQLQTLALGWVRRPEVPLEYGLAVAEELREKLAGTEGGLEQSVDLVRELLDGMERLEQDRLLERLRREGGAAQGALLSESVMKGAPSELLTASLLSLPPAKVVQYLGGTDEALRERLLSACPTRLRSELTEELAVTGRGDRADFIEARRLLLAAVGREATRLGLTSEEMASWAR